MSGFDWDAPVYDDVDREARSDWLAERPDLDLPSFPDLEGDVCDRCGLTFCRHR